MTAAASHWTAGAPLVVAIVAAAAYLAAARRAGRRWPAARSAAFLGGLAVLVLALQSGLDREAERRLGAHMWQHLLLTMAVPPLVLLGAPFELALRTLPPRARASLARRLRGRAARALTRPAAALAVFAAVLVGSHVPAVYEAALRSPPLHDLEHAAYLTAAFLFWAPAIDAARTPAAPSPAGRVLYLLLAMPPMALVGVALMSASRVVYPHYAAVAGGAALPDQRTGGMVMWVGGTLTLAAVVVLAGWAALRAEERRQVAREAYAERGRGAGR